MDITKHEFADVIAGLKVKEPINDRTLVIKFNNKWIFFDKNDVIAMAQHFNVTEYDLSC